MISFYFLLLLAEEDPLVGYNSYDTNEGEEDTVDFTNPNTDYTTGVGKVHSVSKNPLMHYG